MALSSRYTRESFVNAPSSAGRLPEENTLYDYYTVKDTMLLYTIIQSVTPYHPTYYCSGIIQTNAAKFLS